VKVASYNIHKCKGVDGAFRPDRIVNVIREIGADVVALQEVDHRFGQRIGLLNPMAIERITGLKLLIQSDLPDGHGWHGNAILVRGKPKSYERLRMRLPGMEPRGAVVAELDLGKGPFRVIATHLGLLRRSRVEQVGALLEAFHSLPPMPTILLGDFNEWRRLRRSALGLLEPVFGHTPMLPSFPSRMPIFPLDRILGWPMGLVTKFSVHDTPLARRASDHLPLVAHVNFTVKPPLLRSAA
jgi:endonuclease/exonuclease/phosphatase family metal-dependent hydrolase